MPGDMCGNVFLCVLRPCLSAVLISLAAVGRNAMTGASAAASEVGTARSGGNMPRTMVQPCCSTWS